jgi:hypothetical protein
MGRRAHGVRLVREIQDLCETVFRIEQLDHDAHDEFDVTRVDDRLRRIFPVAERRGQSRLTETASRRSVSAAGTRLHAPKRTFGPHLNGY